VNGYGTAMVSENSFRTPIHWEAGHVIANQTIRLDVRFSGVRPEDGQLHALYVEVADD
jgi:hypothetical protein